MKSITRTTLYADNGKILTDGTHYFKGVRLSEGDDPSAYHEITEAEYAEITEKEFEKILEKEIENDIQ